MAMSYSPFENLCHSIQDSNMIGKALPGQLAFVAIVGHGMLDRYPDLKVAFLEFGGEWILYSAGRMMHYTEPNRSRMLDPSMLPEKPIEEYLKVGRIYLGGESSDRVLVQELDLIGEENFLYSSDFPQEQFFVRAEGAR